MEKDVADSVASQGIRSEFTDRELQVLRGLCSGLTPTEIADSLFLNVKTIEAHRAKLLQKTQTRNSINLVLYAIKNKIVNI